MGEIYSNPAAVTVGATSDHPLLGGSGESRLKNPLRKICTAGSVRGESKMGHGGPKRARSWKRRIGPRKAYRLWRSPLLGDRFRASAGSSQSHSWAVSITVMNALQRNDLAADAVLANDRRAKWVGNAQPLTHL